MHKFSNNLGATSKF